MYIQTQGRFNNHAACSLYSSLITTTSIMEADEKWEVLLLERVFEPTLLAVLGLAC